MMENMLDGLVDPQLLFINGEGYFHITGYVYSQTTRMWSAENPHRVHMTKFGVRCAVSARRIIGTIFYH